MEKIIKLSDGSIVRELSNGTFKFKNIWVDEDIIGFVEYTEVYIKDGYDEEFDPYTHIGDIPLVDAEDEDVTNEELEEMIKDLEY